MGGAGEPVSDTELLGLVGTAVQQIAIRQALPALNAYQKAMDDLPLPADSEIRYQARLMKEAREELERLPNQMMQYMTADPDDAHRALIRWRNVVSALQHNADLALADPKNARDIESARRMQWHADTLASLFHPDKLVRSAEGGSAQ